MSSRRVNAIEAMRIAACIGELVDADINGDALLLAIDRAFPGISFRDFIGALLLHRVAREADGYLLIPAGKLQ